MWTALDGNHKNQIAAPKISMARMLLISTFEKTLDSREKISFVFIGMRS